MPEPPAQASPKVGVGEPGGLLATKLFVPRPQPGVVSRPRLLQGLNDGLARGLILVSAPAGSGKSVLVADWGLRRPVAWLSLDAGDNDPARFWRHVAAALDRVRPGVAVDTVKKHLTHIFEKLGAANRTQATARARELGLLADAAEPPTATRL